MTRGKGSTASPLRHSDANELLKRIEIASLKEFMARAFPKATVKQITPVSFRMNCVTPGHVDDHPSFVIDVRRGRAYCEVCKYTTRNLLQLLQDGLGWPFAYTLQQIQKVTGARLIPERLEAQYEDLDLHREALRAIAWVANRHMVNLMEPPEGDPHYAPIDVHAGTPALDWLFKHRQHDKDTAPLLPYGVWPPLHQLYAMVEKRMGDVADLEYRRDKTTRFTPERREKILAKAKVLTEPAGGDWTNSVVFVTGHDFGTPARIRLRRPELDDEKEDNIKWLAGFTPDEPMGFFGLYAPHLSSVTRSEAKSLRLLCVEGENDCISVNERMLADGMGGWLCVASCGNANKTDQLADAGFDVAFMLGDEPRREGGRGEGWLRERLKTSKTVDSRVFVRWHELRSSDGFVKDPDDAVKILGFAHFKRVVFDSFEKAFVACDEWAITRAIEDARDVEASRERTAVVARYGECLANPAQLSHYLDKTCEALGLLPGVVRGQIVRGQDDEAGFVSRLSETFGHDLHFLYKEDTSKGAIVHAYHIASQRPVRFEVSSGVSIMSALANVVGDVQTYYKERVGLPAWLYDERAAEAGSTSMRELQKPLAEYTAMAFQRNFQGLPNRNETITMGLGPHLVEDPTEEYGVRQYLNTGNRVYVGRYVSEDKLSWTALPGPSDGRRLFATTGQAYQGVAQSIDDLNWGNEVTIEDLQATFSECVRIFEHWGWRRGRIEAILLAALLFHLAMPHFCPDKLILGVTGPTTSGKSTLVAVLAGGQVPRLQLIDAVGYQTNYSPASLSIGFNGATLLMALEEFSKGESGAQKTRQVEDITELLRQVNTPGGARVTRAVPGGTEVRILHTNVVTTSLAPPADVQDANRRLEIETARVTGHPDPGAELMRAVGPEMFMKIRRQLNLGLFKFYRQYKVHYEEVSTKLATERVAPFDVDKRFLRNFAGPGAMMALLGMKWEPFVVQCTVARKDTLDAYANATPANTLFDVVLRTPSVRVGNNFASVMSLLADPEKWMVLNTTQCGVLYNNDAGYLVVEWIPVMSQGGVLHRAEPWSRTPYHQLKYQLDQHPLAAPQAQVQSLGVAEFLSTYGIAPQLHNLSVLKLGPTVAAMRSLNSHAGAAGETHSSQAHAPGTPQAPAGGLPPGMRNPNGNNL